jgi:hypothetical protein
MLFTTPVVGLQKKKKKKIDSLIPMSQTKTQDAKRITVTVETQQQLSASMKSRVPDPQRRVISKAKPAVFSRQIVTRGTNFTHRRSDNMML